MSRVPLCARWAPEARCSSERRAWRRTSPQDTATELSAARRSVDESGPALLERLVKYSGIPIVAIGGIVPQHVAPLRRLGVHGVAAIRGIWDVEHSERAVIDYLSAYDSEVG